MNARSARTWRSRLVCALHCRRRDDDLIVILSTFVVCYVLFSR